MPGATQPVDMATTPTQREELDSDEVFVRVGDRVETIRQAEAIRFDRQTVTGSEDEVPLLVFVGDESYRARLDDPGAAIGVEIMGTDRWTIGFLDRTTDQYITLLGVDILDSFFEMVRAVDTLRLGISFPESPEAMQCANCRGTDHMNHVIDLDTAAGEAFIDAVEPLVGTEIDVQREPPVS